MPVLIKQLSAPLFFYPVSEIFAYNVVTARQLKLFERVATSLLPLLIISSISGIRLLTCHQGDQSYCLLGGHVLQNGTSYITYNSSGEICK